jgi:hypothetical protein
VEPRLHPLSRGKRKETLQEIAQWRPSSGKRGEIIRAKQNYFAGQEERMNYEEMADRGWPIGSGALESAYRQQQCWFKRPRQFWTAKGLRNLSALTEAI